ncbi:glycogen/starch/alpha-glucan phosphorylase [Clostridium merdae]|uniref:glycogen/starch/alpha-glucan phosphorylase n=1 Tax=Clostridium merdae TaxID=1958780 RepID=UPI001180CF01|nr:glycogen/starch/alpha-glucan phosphorylase [Clostridium merdae]
MNQFEQQIDQYLDLDYGITARQAIVEQLYNAVSKAAMKSLSFSEQSGKKGCYFSAEFLLGRLIYSNLLNLGLLERCRTYLNQNGFDAGVFESIDDDALGNGGLGRLAACFLDSAATHGIPLNGFGIRYKYGLFHQYFQDGFQKETADDWLKAGDPWGIRGESEAVTVKFADQTVRAIPYDMPVIGYGGNTVNRLRLWQAEPLSAFDFEQFNLQKYDEAVEERIRAEEITAVLYPNDDTPAGKQLRLKQQYFFTSASLQSLVKEFLQKHGESFSHFPKEFAIQLNDTHPVIAIPELLRILMEEHQLSFDEAFPIVRDTFAYTNHTIMAEALEKWEVSLFLTVAPQVYPYVVLLQNALNREIKERNIEQQDKAALQIISGGQIHMARLAVYASHATNGVAKIHSELLKSNVLPEWYRMYPERFQNKTNGITQRRWLALCNQELSGFINERIGNGWVTDLNQLKRLTAYLDDSASLAQFREIKRQKKIQLCNHVRIHEYGFELNPDFIFDVQIKRLHEYKRQLLNAFSILDIYFAIKDGTLTDFTPTAFLFGAKAAPGYRRAKGIIKFINEIARLISADPEVKDKLQVLFVQNYNVSYAEKLIPAADVSEQISTAGTEASGTGNMKLMLNGAVTLGTLDGANIEIVEQAGEENNYIFGATVDEIAQLSNTYHPKALYESNPRIRRVVDTLIDGTLDDGDTGLFRELYDSLLKGVSWHKPDQYYLLQDFESYCEAKLRANRDYRNAEEFSHKCLANTARAGYFSSDRTVREYAQEIWGI